MLEYLKYINYKRAANYGKLLASYVTSRIKGRPYVWHNPAFISVEPANYCNLHCPECPVGIGAIPKKAAQFPVDTYYRLIDELAPSLHMVNLYFQGEPLFSENFCQMASYAKRHKLYTQTSTNGQLVTSELAKDIVQSGLEKIIISIDGATQESYEQYRKNGILQKAINSSRLIAFWKEQLHSKTPVIEIQCLRLKSNEHDWKKLKQMYKSWGGERLVFKTAQFYDYENGNLLMPQSKYSRYAKLKNGKYKIKHKLHNHCLRLWSGAVIDAHANVLPCCFDKYGQYKFGNITNKRFCSCWHSPKAEHFRMQILQKRSETDICTNCTTR